MRIDEQDPSMMANPAEAGRADVRTVLGVAGASVLALGAVLAATGTIKVSGSGSNESLSPDQRAAIGACDDLSGSAQFPSQEKPLKDKHIDDEEEAARYVDGLPFANDDNEFDPEATALMFALIKPATGNDVDPNYSEVEEYNRAIERYSGDDGLEEAKTDCRLIMQVIKPTGQYTRTYGDESTGFIRFEIDENNRLRTKKIVSKETRDGLEISPREDDEVEGLDSTLIQDGYAYRKDTEPKEGAKDRRRDGASGDDRADGPSGDRTARARGGVRIPRDHNAPGGRRRNNGNRGNDGSQPNGNDDGCTGRGGPRCRGDGPSRGGDRTPTTPPTGDNPPPPTGDNPPPPTGDNPPPPTPPPPTPPPPPPKPDPSPTPCDEFNPCPNNRSASVEDANAPQYRVVNLRTTADGRNVVSYRKV